MRNYEKKREQVAKAHPSELIRRPELPEPEATDVRGNLSRKDVKDKAYISQLRLSEANFSNLTAERMFFDSVSLSQVQLSETHFEGFDLTDARMEICDFSNADWHQASLNRVEIIGCRGNGIKLIEATLRHVLVEDCNFSYAQFRVAKFEYVKFVNCNLRGADFSQADLRGVAFVGCELREATFSYSKLQGTDLRKSTIDNIKVGAESLKGAIVEPMQAAYLAKIMGLDVRWEDG